MDSTLYIVATPIGNLEDMTIRAIAVLTSVDLVLCEDTRTTSKLFGRYGIKTPMLSYHAHSGSKKMEAVAKLLENNKKVALVSDAGTPGISDPGSELVMFLKEKLPGLKVCAVPGPSALTAALSVAGMPVTDFLFLGFLPHKKGRETLFKEMALSKRAVIFYESPHRLMKTLESLSKILSEERRVVVLRELTKIYESALGGSAKELLQYFSSHKDEVRGEIVIMVDRK